MIKVIVKQRYPVPVEVQPQNGIQVKAYQAGPPGTQGPPGEGAVIGPNQVAFGAPVTGVITGSANLLWSDGNSYLNIASSLVVGRLTGSFYGIQALPGATPALYASNGAGIYFDTAYTFYTAPGAQSFVQLHPNQGQVGHYATRASFYGNIGGGNPNFFDLTTDNNVKIRGFATNVRLHGGEVATDYGTRVDVTGVKVGPYSNLGTVNLYPFEVQDSIGNSIFYHNGLVNDGGIAIQPKNGGTTLSIKYFPGGAITGWYVQPQIGFAFSIFAANSASRTRWNTDGTVYAGGNWRMEALAGTGNRSVHVDANGDLAATEPAFRIVNEIPSGLINGSNATFTSAFDFVPGTEEVFLNGIKLVKLEDYNTTGNNQIDLFVSPLTGEDLIINYSKI